MFKFKIGELVVMEVSIAHCKIVGSGNTPHVFAVTERSMIENAGGTWYEYHISALHMSETCDEVKLVAFADYEVNKNGNFK